MRPRAAEAAWRRSAAYARLSLPFSRSPEPILEALARGDYERALARDVEHAYPGVLAPRLDALQHAAAASQDEAARARLRSDHARLFSGPGRAIAPPYESVYRTPQRQMMGEPATRARSAYEAAGVQVTGPADPPDRLDTELQFMALLAGMEAEARDEESLLAALRAQADFLDGHLARWTGPFAAQVASAPDVHALFVSTAQLVDAFVALDLRVLGSRLAAAEPPPEAAR